MNNCLKHKLKNSASYEFVNVDNLYQHLIFIFFEIFQNVYVVLL